jgi:hypothetical protein
MDNPGDNPWVRGTTRYVLLFEPRLDCDHVTITGWKARGVEPERRVVHQGSYRTREEALAWAGAEMPGAPVLSFWYCAHCGQKNLDDYMVTDDVWAEAGLRTWFGRFHFSCLEEKLGRPLRIEDFPPFPINRNLHRGYAMGSSCSR